MRDVSAALTTLSYAVEIVAEGPRESADLSAHNGPDRLVVEIKTRIDDERLAHKLRQHAVVDRDGPVVRSNALGRIVRKAWKQIQNTQLSFPSLGLLWFQPTPVLGMSASAEQMEANLIGRRTVSFKLGDRFGFAPAFLVARCDFHRYPSLDAAVVMSEKGGHLLVNPFGTRKDDLRGTALHRFFQQHNAVLDLDLLESNESHFILRSKCDWSDEHAVLSALREQHASYGFTFSDTHFFQGVARMNLQELP